MNVDSKTLESELKERGAYDVLWDVAGWLEKDLSEYWEKMGRKDVAERMKESSALVKKAAQGLLLSLLIAFTAHAQDRQCSPDDTLCVAEVAAARLSAANARIASLTQINKDQEAIIAGKDQLIGIKDQIISNLQKLDTNSLKIDQLGRDKEDLWKEQHFDDKKTIGKLESDLDSCKTNQKWIGASSAVLGGIIGYKIRGAGTFTNPFQTNLQYQGMFITSPEERMRKALRK